MERPAECGAVLSCDPAALTGVITLDAGGSATFTVATVAALNPSDARNWPSLVGASFLAGQRVLCTTSAGVASVVVPDPNAVDLDGTGEVA